MRVAGLTGATLQTVAIWSTTTSTAAGCTSAMRSRYSPTRRWTACPTAGIDVPQPTLRCSSSETPSSSVVTRTPRRPGSGLSASPRTPGISFAASAA